ncbi:MAG: hypothetical protein EAZ92_05365 [Candidatus Kapaibacterium sp.]|nr:MAG: hypothetical protein EAZ92_05365 [Candidatus Kapabacteria bacterium]
MIFIESDKFTKKVSTILSDDQLAQIQNAIMSNPNIGVLIKPNLCGLRKLRASDGTKGKRGGVRVIYFWIVSDTMTLLLDLCTKGKKEDLTKKEMQELCAIIKELSNA